MVYIQQLNNQRLGNSYHILLGIAMMLLIPEPLMILLTGLILNRFSYWVLIQFFVELPVT